MNKKPTYLDDLRPVLLWLLERGLSQSQIAREIDLSRATVNAVIRKNERWMPGYGAGARLVSLFKERGGDIGFIYPTKESSHA